jgi:hypothetical protein
VCWRTVPYNLRIMQPEAANDLEPITNPEKGCQDIVRTYYKSFYISQGFDAAQDLWLRAAGSLYGVILPRTERDDIVAAAGEQCLRLKMPADHASGFTSQEVREQFTRHWRYFAHTIVTPDLCYDPASVSTQEVLANATMMLVSGDEEQMRTDTAEDNALPYVGRSVRTPDGDRRRSFVRQHLLAHEPIGDRVLDVMLYDAAQLLMGTLAVRGTDPRHLFEWIRQQGLLRLASAWEAHHPDVSFWAVVTAAGAPALSSLIQKPEAL